MSLKQEERDIMVALEMEKADCTFAEHEGLTEKGYWSNLANRLYYALFHAVSAMLIFDGREVGSHKVPPSASTSIMSARAYSPSTKVRSIRRCRPCARTLTTIVILRFPRQR